MLRIAEARKARGWTQEQLAEAIGTTQQSVQRWESGQEVPKAPTIVKIAKALGVSVPSLLKADDAESEPLSADEREMLELFRALPKRGRRAVLAGLRDYAGGKRG